MSTFAVEIRTIDRIAPHPNADKLELAFLRDVSYQFVVQKGSFNANQPVAYFPTDALLKPELATIIGVPVSLDKAGVPKEHTRIKAIRLRGQRSEGVLTPLTVLSLDPKLAYEGMDITDELGVTKYEVPETVRGLRTLQTDLMALPGEMQKYDIENAQRFPAVFDRMLNHTVRVDTDDVVDDSVIITEKLEGTNWWARILKDGETFQVGQRNFMIRPPGEGYKNALGEFQANPGSLNPYWQAFFEQEMDEVLYDLHRVYPGYDITIRGELIGSGIQGNYYAFPQGKRTVYLFEIELSGSPMNAITALDWFQTLQVAHVPVIYQGSLAAFAPDVNSLVDAASGFTAISPVPLSQLLSSERKLREGIVVKPVVEAYDEEIGRRFLKVRDPIYLEKT